MMNEKSARVVMHQSRVRNLANRTITSTLCGRNRTTGDGMNIAETQAQVTCKFCLRAIARATKGAPTNGK
jgi:hypothetical protein